MRTKVTLLATTAAVALGIGVPQAVGAVQVSIDAVYVNPGHHVFDHQGRNEIPLRPRDRRAVRVVIENIGDTQSRNLRVRVLIQGPGYERSTAKVVYGLPPGALADVKFGRLVARFGDVKFAVPSKLTVTVEQLRPLPGDSGKPYDRVQFPFVFRL